MRGAGQRLQQHLHRTGVALQGQRDQALPGQALLAGIAVRAGTHCAMPLMEHMGVTATCRASFAMYNTKAEVDALISALELCHDLFA